MAAAAQKPRLEREFQAAVAQYESGHFPEAAQRLEAMVREVPESFDVHELLGLVYSAQSLDAKASPHLQKAVRLKPDSASARTNLAANLMRLGKAELAGVEFRKAVELEPKNFDTNHNLGEFYIAAGKLPQAIPSLEKAYQLKPEAYDNGYNLALAYVETSKIDLAERVTKELLGRQNTAELHNLLAEIEEKKQNFVAAANEYEAAAHMDPSESNLFDWASELLLHRTLDAAVDIFQRATERYPKSPRLAIGLGMALYSRGNYDEAVKALLRGADLDPSDAQCYYFLSKAYDSSPGQADEVIQRFRRFMDLRPRNGRAPYYYAMSLWKGRRAQDAEVNVEQIEGLLKKSVALDPKFPEAHLQLGNLYSDQKKYEVAIAQYQQAIALNPDLADAHYRLGQALVHTGKKEQAQEQLRLYQKLRTEHLSELERQRAEVRQFVYSEKKSAAGNQ